MCREEFIHFMDEQIVEIEKYKKDKTSDLGKNDNNDCVFEWIENNAKEFWKKWEKK